MRVEEATPKKRAPGPYDDDVSRFRREVWKPAVEEVTRTLERDGKTVLQILSFNAHEDTEATQVIAEVHDGCVRMRELADRGPEALADTLVVTEPHRDLRGRAIRFFVSTRFHIGPAVPRALAR